MSVIEDLTEERPCANPDCDNEQVEPDSDGEIRFWECFECGYAWGYEKVGQSTKIEATCAMGIPESVRRSASAPMEKAIAGQNKPGVVDLGLTIGRRPQ